VGETNSIGGENRYAHESVYGNLVGGTLLSLLPRRPFRNSDEGKGKTVIQSFDLKNVTLDGNLRVSFEEFETTIFQFQMTIF